ncbi:MFS transporter [Streptomyces europaeiscabiei]|uniref:MFS transporter n=1 Tax=Streptomyces europaeiscabiei TaxID=146819 RepID=UPI002E1277AD|nr:MFS transporter [Streptomyces europaeiscabiei]
MLPTTATTSGHRLRWPALAVLSVSLLIIVMDMTVLNVALPSISAELQPSATDLLWMVDIYALVLSGLLVTMTSLSDRFGRKKMLLLGLGLFGLASLGALLTNSSNELIAVRALLGVGGAMIMPSTLSMIRHLFTDAKERALAIGVWAAMSAVGAALGPVLGGVLLEHFSWRSAFLVNVPVMVVGIVAGLIVLPESRNSNPGRWDALAAALSMIGMVALVYAIKHFGKGGLGDDGAQLAAGIALVTLTWFGFRCLRSDAPLLELRLFKNRPFSAGVIAALSTSLAMGAAMLLLTQWMQLVQDYSPLETGIRLLPTAIAGGIVTPLASTLAQRIGARNVLSGGLAISGAGMAVMGLAPASYSWIVLAQALIGAGMGSLTVASVAIMAAAPPEKSGSAAAIEETSYELGGALGVAALGSVAAAVYSNALPVDELTANGATPATADTIRESLGGALDVARDAGPAGVELAGQARAAFIDSLDAVGLWGAAVLGVAAVAVWLLTPKDLDITAAQH